MSDQERKSNHPESVEARLDDTISFADELALEEREQAAQLGNVDQGYRDAILQLGQMIRSGLAASTVESNDQNQ